MKWLKLGRRRKPRRSALPVELVSAIEDVGVVYRSFVEDEYGEQMPRPLATSFLGSRPIYLDDPEAVAKLLRAHWPELTDQQVKRAFSLLSSRVAKLRGDRQDRIDILRTGGRRRGGWMRETEAMTPWEL
ncbi:hypothetical protein [Halomonas alimentaria]|uniref:hypothetical protein n=1 Tax=Halomonas alimentaria TaxID=147248 RepID=UPI002490A64D|nr:hypothetical protein [Halomonas alimentaria]